MGRLRFSDLSGLCQFVMEVDEMLYSAFAPQRLKSVFQHAKTLELKPLRRFFGLDLAPVFKLLLTGIMLGLMVGFSIAPQTEMLKAAGDAMCGKCDRYRPARTALLMAPTVAQAVHSTA